MNLTAGSTLQNGKYILNTVLEQAGFGATYQAICTRSEQPVVIQTLREDLRQQPEFARVKQHFLEEANQLAKCQHSNLVKTIDVFEELDSPFLVTNQVSGRTLAEIVQSSGALAESQALHAIRQLGAALRVLHQHHLLHRNIKPKNLVQCDRTGFVVLINFGIAQGENFSDSPQQGHLSAGYTALEQYYPKVGLTPATDVYGLAATFYFLLTGKTPTAAPMRDRQPLPDLRQLKSDVNPAIEQAILQGMAVEAHLRPQSIEAWLALLPNPFAPTTNGSNNGLNNNNGSNNGSNGSNGVRQADVSTFITSPPINGLEVASSSTAVVAPGGTSAKPAVGHSSTTAAVTIAPANFQASPAEFTDRWWRVLKITSTIAVVAGIGFGLAVRISGGRSPGSTLFNTEQAFPPSDNWPGTRVADPLPEVDSQNTLPVQPEPEPIYQRPEPAPLPPQPAQTPEMVEPEDTIVEEASPTPSPVPTTNAAPPLESTPSESPADLADPAPTPAAPAQPDLAPSPAPTLQPPTAPTNSN